MSSSRSAKKATTSKDITKAIKSSDNLVSRNGIVFKQQFSTEEEVNNQAGEIRGASSTVSRSRRSLISRIFGGCMGSDIEYNLADQFVNDTTFFADCFVTLSHGVTAYRYIEPRVDDGVDIDKLPITILLHGLYNFSYMWADLADTLVDNEQGVHSRVLVFDFYGRGRSPWTGVPISLDALVVQTKELIDFLGLDKTPLSIIGYDLGAVVGVGFAAKYPFITKSLTLISPLGIKYRGQPREKLLCRKYIGEYMILNRKNDIPNAQNDHYYNNASYTSHFPYVCRDIEMIKWQIINTPGYLGAILSTYRKFPIRRMDDLYNAIGLHTRSVLMVLGDHDVIISYNSTLKKLTKWFPNGQIVDVRDCGHNVLGEKFADAANEILCFHKVFFGAK
jgi:pimeloyl-ACP methyl ester carboxylesterase